MFQVEPQDVTARSGEDVALRCQAAGEPVPSVQWLRAGRPVQASRRLRALPDGSLWMGRVERRDAGAYECVAHNVLGSVTARAFLVVKGTGRLLRNGGLCVVWGGTWPSALPAPRLFAERHKLLSEPAGRGSSLFAAWCSQGN